MLCLLIVIGVAGLFKQWAAYQPTDGTSLSLIYWRPRQTEWLRTELSLRTDLQQFRETHLELVVQGRPTPRLGLMHPSVSETSLGRSSSRWRAPTLFIGEATGLGKPVTSLDHG